MGKGFAKWSSRNCVGEKPLGVIYGKIHLVLLLNTKSLLGLLLKASWVGADACVGVKMKTGGRGGLGVRCEDAIWGWV